MTASETTWWSGRRVLVTGATGLVGSWLCRRLVVADVHVVALVRDADPQSELLRSRTVERLSVVNGRLEDDEEVLRAVDEHEIDTIFHLGAQTIVGTALRSPLATLRTNLLGTAAVLDVARRRPELVERVVLASSDKAYGSQATLPYTEESPLDGRHPYDVSKAAGDLVAETYHRVYEVPLAIARCGNIYGGGDLNWSRIVPGTIRARLRGEPLIVRSDGTFLRDYVFVEDVVDAYLLLGRAITEQGIAGEAFNFGPERPLSVLEMHDAVCAALGVPGPAPVVLDEARSEIRDQYLDSTKARQELAWEPTFTLEEGLARTVTWYRALLEA
jgi:CDP-glucose 4,6-dehydratase